MAKVSKFVVVEDHSDEGYNIEEGDVACQMWGKIDGKWTTVKRKVRFRRVRLAKNFGEFWDYDQATELLARYGCNEFSLIDAANYGIDLKMRADKRNEVQGGVNLVAELFAHVKASGDMGLGMAYMEAASKGERAAKKWLLAWAGIEENEAEENEEEENEGN